MEEWRGGGMEEWRDGGMEECPARVFGPLLKSSQSEEGRGLWVYGQGTPWRGVLQQPHYKDSLEFCDFHPGWWAVGEG